MPFAFLHEGCNLRLRHPLGFKVLQALDLANLPQRMRYSTAETSVMMVTHRLMKISAGSERLEIRRYEDTDEGINLNGIQDYWVGRMD